MSSPAPASRIRVPITCSPVAERVADIGYCLITLSSFVERLWLSGACRGGDRPGLSGGGHGPTVGDGAGDPVCDERDDEPDDPGDVVAADERQQRAGVEALVDEQELRNDAEQVAGDRDRLEPPVDAPRGVKRRDVVFSVPEEVEVEDVDCAPRQEDEGEHVEEVDERVEE